MKRKPGPKPGPRQPPLVEPPLRPVAPLAEPGPRDRPIGTKPSATELLVELTYVRHPSLAMLDEAIRLVELVIERRRTQ